VTQRTRNVNSTLRANPYPKVTDLICRLPLPTLFLSPEAVHLGNLLRLSVRLGKRLILSPRFSRVVRGAPERKHVCVLDTSKHEVLCQPSRPFSSQPDSRAIKQQALSQNETENSHAHTAVQHMLPHTKQPRTHDHPPLTSHLDVAWLLKRKENSSQDPCQLLEVQLCCHKQILGSQFRNINLIPFRPEVRVPEYLPTKRAGQPVAQPAHPPNRQNTSPLTTELSCVLGSTDPCPNAVHTEPFSTSVFKVVSFLEAIRYSHHTP